MRQAAIMLEFADQWERQGKTHTHTHNYKECCVSATVEAGPERSTESKEKGANMFVKGEVKNASLKK